MMNNQDILGMDSALAAAKEMPYGANMPISAALVIEMVERIAELENARSETDPLLKALLYCCACMHSDYAEGNYGDAGGWLRHIEGAYGRYRDAIYDLEALKKSKL
jgi:hypothetical protein